MDPVSARSFILEKLARELPRTRTYHCLEHTLDVYASVIDIAEQEGLNGEDLTLLKTAALYHDAGFTEQDVDHENAGCAIARRALPDFGFSGPQVDHICAMIQATRIPQDPKDAAARILCDADLDYLGRSDFRRIGNSLFQEMRQYGMLKNELEWNRLQVGFLEKHRYFTRTNVRLREPIKQQHLARLRDWMADQ